MNKILRAMPAFLGALLLSANLAYADDKANANDQSTAKGEAQNTQSKTADKEAGKKETTDKNESTAAKLQKDGEAGLKKVQEMEQQAGQVRSQADQIKGLFSKPKK